MRLPLDRVYIAQNNAFAERTCIPAFLRRTSGRGGSKREDCAPDVDHLSMQYGCSKRGSMVRRCKVMLKDFEFGIGSGSGIRTLNLAVNRSAPPVQKWRFLFAECRSEPPNGTVCRPRCCTTRTMMRRGGAELPAVLKTAFLTQQFYGRASLVAGQPGGSDAKSSDR